MENETEREINGGPKKLDDKYILPVAIIVAGVMVSGAMIFNPGTSSLQVQAVKNIATQNGEAILTDGGQILPIDAEKKMLATLIANGAIDASKLSKVTELNLLWAFGLANKNQILESGPIMDPRYGGPENMASVGGWNITTGLVMDHYDKHALVTLTSGQQALVDKIAKGIYRPCCNNSTYFPDCNHGMAMLGLLEYLASQGGTEDQLWNAALTANISWFPDQYQTISKYLLQKGLDLKSISSQELLSAEYSSASGFAKIAAQTPQNNQQKSGGGCGVGTVGIIPSQQKRGNCGI